MSTNDTQSAGPVARLRALASSTSVALVVVVCVLGYFGYVRVRERENESRLQDLLVLQDGLETAVRSAWGKVQRPCAAAEVKDRPAWCDEIDRSTWTLRRPQGKDDPRSAASRIVLCMEAHPDRPEVDPPCTEEEIDVRPWLDELELHRRFLSVMIVDGSGSVTAEWKWGPGRVTAISLPADLSGQDKPVEKAPGKPGGGWPALTGTGPRIAILPRVEAIVLGERDLDLFLAALELPRGRAGGKASERARVDPASKRSQETRRANEERPPNGETLAQNGPPEKVVRTKDSPPVEVFLCAIAKRHAPGVTPRVAAVLWPWALPAGVVGLVLLAALPFLRQSGGLARNHLLVAALCLGLASILGLAWARSTIEQRSLERTMRARLNVDVSRVVARIEESLEASAATVQEIAQQIGGTCTAPKWSCIADQLASLAENKKEVWFLADEKGNQTWLNSTDTKVNRGGREYFRTISSSEKSGVVRGLYPTVTANKGDVRWILGARASASSGKELVIAAIKPPLGTKRWDITRLVVDRKGRILFAQPELFQLTGTRIDEILSPAGAVSESLRMGVALAATEVTFRRQPALVIGERLDFTKVEADAEAPYFVVEIAVLGATREAVLHGLASGTALAGKIWSVPLLFLILVTLLAPQRVLSSLYPQRPPVARYVAGSVSILVLFVCLEGLVVPVLAPWARPQLAIVLSVLAPWLAYSILASDEASTSRALRVLFGPERLFRWYPVVYLGLVHGAAWFLGAERGAWRGELAPIAVSALLCLASFLAAKFALVQIRRGRWHRMRRGWLRIRHLHWGAYVVAVGCTLMLQFGYPSLLVLDAVYEVSREAISRTGPMVVKDGAVATSATPLEGGLLDVGDWEASRGLLSRNLGESGERRLAALAADAPLPQGRLVLTGPSRVLTPMLLLAAFAITVAGWGAFCSGTFAWIVPSRAIPARARASSRGDRLTAVETGVLLAVRRDGLLRWQDLGVASSLIARGWLSNRDGLRVSGKRLRETSPAEVNRRGAIETDHGRVAGGTLREAPSGGVFGLLAIAVLGLPLAVLMLASPELFKNALLWASTILVAVGRPMAQGK